LFTTTAIRSNNCAGGDNCRFATFVGALAGAVYGVHGDAGIPQAWIDRLGARTKIDTILSKLFS
jgi:ADP-ribosylglycohydrolase